ncbi:MAG: hypothetical protein ABI175_04540, partial [Polyangiales bacterium]
MSVARRSWALYVEAHTGCSTRVAVFGAIEVESADDMPALQSPHPLAVAFLTVTALTSLATGCKKEPLRVSAEITAYTPDAVVVHVKTSPPAPKFTVSTGQDGARLTTDANGEMDYALPRKGWVRWSSIHFFVEGKRFLDKERGEATVTAPIDLDNLLRIPADEKEPLWFAVVAVVADGKKAVDANKKRSPRRDVNRDYVAVRPRPEG